MSKSLLGRFTTRLKRWGPPSLTVSVHPISSETMVRDHERGRVVPGPGPLPRNLTSRRSVGRSVARKIFTLLLLLLLLLTKVS